jgi:hypothetical protein
VRVQTRKESGIQRLKAAKLAEDRRNMRATLMDDDETATATSVRWRMACAPPSRRLRRM